MDRHASLHHQEYCQPPKVFIKVIRGLPALEVLNFQSSGFLKALQYTESPNHLQILPGIKVWSCY